MLNNITNFFNLIATKKVKTQLDATDLIAIGTKDPRFTGNYQPTLIEYANFVSGLVGGSNGQVLFNDNDTIAGAANSFWDNTNGRLGIGTNIPLGILHLKETAATTRMVMDGDAGQSKIITFRTNGLQRFGLYLNNIAESGGNAGSNLALRAYNDAGSLLSTPLYIHRNSGNVGINTTTDAGFRLDVNGTARVQGATTITPAGLTGTSATSALDITQTWNTTGTPTALLLNVTNTLSNANSKLIDLQTGGVTAFNVSANGLMLTRNIAVTGGAGSTQSMIILNKNVVHTSGIVNGMDVSSALTIATGNGIYNQILLQSTINQTGTATGVTRGLYVNTTLTSAFDFRAIEVANGITILGASTTAKASLRIPSGTAPTSPVNGDIWFDGTNIQMRIGGITRTFTLI